MGRHSETKSAARHDRDGSLVSPGSSSTSKSNKRPDAHRSSRHGGSSAAYNDTPEVDFQITDRATFIEHTTLQPKSNDDGAADTAPLPPSDLKTLVYAYSEGTAADEHKIEVYQDAELTALRDVEAVRAALAVDLGIKQPESEEDKKTRDKIHGFVRTMAAWPNKTDKDGFFDSLRTAGSANGWEGLTACFQEKLAEKSKVAKWAFALTEKGEQLEQTYREWSATQLKNLRESIKADERADYFSNCAAIEQAVDGLRAKIEAGDLPEGTLLAPSYRAASESGADPGTIIAIMYAPSAAGHQPSTAETEAQKADAKVVKEEYYTLKQATAAAEDAEMMDAYGALAYMEETRRDPGLHRERMENEWN